MHPVEQPKYHKATIQAQRWCFLKIVFNLFIKVPSSLPNRSLQEKVPFSLLYYWTKTSKPAFSTKSSIKCEKNKNRQQIIKRFCINYGVWALAASEFVRTPKFRPSGKLRPLAPFPVTSGPLQSYHLQQNQPLAAISTTCSNIKHLQRPVADKPFAAR